MQQGPLVELSSVGKIILITTTETMESTTESLAEMNSLEGKGGYILVKGGGHFCNTKNYPVGWMDGFEGFPSLSFIA